MDRTISESAGTRSPDGDGARLIDFVRRLARLRREHAVLRSPRFLHGRHEVAPGLQDIAWFDASGRPPTIESWNDPQERRLTVDLVRQRITGPDGLEFGFEIEPEEREMLLEGLDAIDLTLKHRDAIEAFRARDRGQRPWIYLQ